MRVIIDLSDMNAEKKKLFEKEAGKNRMSLKQYLEAAIQQNVGMILGENWDDD